jgi:glyoxalase family protein
MSKPGIHHVTAIASKAPRNLDFYTRVLGLRLVKRTVNFDDPGSYHLYYGDETGRPGTILTFFPWAHAAPGRLGIGETRETMLRVPEGAIGFWAHRFVEKGVTHEAPVKRFGETVLPFKDPDGMRLALTGVPGIEGEAVWAGGGIAAEHAIRGLHGVSLLLEDAGPEDAILTDVLGFEETGSDETVTRFKAKGSAIGGIVDIQAASGFLPARMGAGSVHHIAFRASGDEEQAAMTAKLARDLKIGTTRQLDRNYFRSVYFRSPGGVLFEIATDEPGFTVDEPAGRLGEALKLPPFLEPRRSSIEAALPALEIEDLAPSK